PLPRSGSRVRIPSPAPTKSTGYQPFSGVGDDLKKPRKTPEIADSLHAHCTLIAPGMRTRGCYATPNAHPFLGRRSDPVQHVFNLKEPTPAAVRPALSRSTFRSGRGKAGECRSERRPPPRSRET